MRPRFLTLASALLLAWAPAGLAQDGSAATTARTPATTAKITSGLPKYGPARAPAPDSGPGVDLREVDRPRNAIPRLPRDLLPPESLRMAPPAAAAADEPPPEGVLRLPRYHVQDRRLPAMKEREMLTPEGRIELGLKRHPGLRIGNFFGLNRGIAAAMVEEEFAVERARELQDLYELAAFADSLPRPKPDDESGSTAPEKK